MQGCANCATADGGRGVYKVVTLLVGEAVREGPDVLVVWKGLFVAFADHIGVLIGLLL